MRYLAILALLWIPAACSPSKTTPKKDADVERERDAKVKKPKPKGDPLTRVIFRQFRPGRKLPIFWVENQAGRDIKKLRSRRLRPGAPVPVYITDEQMREVLKLMNKKGFKKYSQKAVPKPYLDGAMRGEVLVWGNRGARALYFRIGRNNPTPRKAQYAYRDCNEIVRAVHGAGGQAAFQVSGEGTNAFKVSKRPNHLGGR